jgi:hypothetical protein
MGRGTTFGWVILVAALAATTSRADTPPAGARSLPATISTRFDPARDGLPFGNAGDLASPDGNCFGMSLVAIDNYVRRTTNPPARARAPRQPAPPTTWDPAQADPRAQATAGLAQATASQLDNPPLEARPPLTDPAPIRGALDRIAATGVPEVLVISGPGGGHAVVVYGYRDGALQVYDPNYPGEAIAWPWDPVAGLGKNPKATPGSFYDTLDRALPRPYDAHQTRAAMDRLREACAAQDAECVDRYPGLTARLRRLPDGSVEVSGQAAPTAVGLAPSDVWVAVNGQPVGLAPVNRFGTFRATVPASALGADQNRVAVVGQRQHNGFTQFAGFAELDVGPPVPAVQRRRPGQPETVPPPVTKAPSPSRGLAGGLPR